MTRATPTIIAAVAALALAVALAHSGRSGLSSTTSQLPSGWRRETIVPSPLSSIV
jgi:hypothetical protein